VSSKYPILPSNKIIKEMNKLGFNKSFQKGSHAKSIILSQNSNKSWKNP